MDGITSQLTYLKQMSWPFSPILSNLINKSFAQRLFPQSPKRGKILPIFKSKDKLNIANYRLLSWSPNYSFSSISYLPFPRKSRHLGPPFFHVQLAHTLLSLYIWSIPSEIKPIMLLYSYPFRTNCVVIPSPHLSNSRRPWQGASNHDVRLPRYAFARDVNFIEERSCHCVVRGIDEHVRKKDGCSNHGAVAVVGTRLCRHDSVPADCGIMQQQGDAETNNQGH